MTSLLTPPVVLVVTLVSYATLKITELNLIESYHNLYNGHFIIYHNYMMLTLPKHLIK